MAKREPFSFCEETVAPGEARIINIPLSNLATHTPMNLPVHITHGRKDGPTLFVSAAIHGDEIIGVEVIRRLLKIKALKSLRGTLMLIPIVNVYGFIAHERYLQDRRDRSPQEATWRANQRGRGDRRGIGPFRGNGN